MAGKKFNRTLQFFTLHSSLYFGLLPALVVTALPAEKTALLLAKASDAVNFLEDATAHLLPTLSLKMARKKATPKSKANCAQSQAAEPQEGTDHQAAGRRRRYDAHRSVLTELRRIERHMQPAIPRLPFQRVVREIATEYRINLRWTPSALLCLQESLEDWLVEFFEDAYYLAAHAHRITIMPRDFNTLRIIRYRHEHLLQPILSGDQRMADILTIPPLHPRRSAQERGPVQHDRNTRSQGQKSANVGGPTIIEIPFEPNVSVDNATTEPGPSESRRERRSQQERRLQERARRVTEQEAENVNAINEFSGFNQVRVGFTISGQSEVDALSMEDLLTFKSAHELMTDVAVKVVLWMFVSELEANIQSGIVLLDPIVLPLLRDPQMTYVVFTQTNAGYFRHLHDDTKIVVVPYHEENHWSVAVFDVQTCVCYYANSDIGYHGVVRNVIQKIVHCVELVLFESDLVSRIQNRRVKTSPQVDVVSCGWRACLNAILLIKSILEMQDPLDIATYTDLDLSEFRVAWTPRLVTAVQAYAAEEIRMAPIRAQQRAEEIQRREEENLANVRRYHESRRIFRECQIEVEEFVQSQRQSRNEDRGPP